jgi:hypothetical protein
MAIDFQQVHEKIVEIGKNVQQRKKALDDRRVKARKLLHVYKDELDLLCKKIEKVKVVDPALRCAIPRNESLISHFPLPDLPLQATLIAADGSQINPDRHGQIQYALVNVGAIVVQLNSGESPKIVTDSQLLFEDELLTQSNNFVTEAMVALKRDLKERTKLYELAQNYPTPVITFTDGPIELWGVRDGEDAKTYRESLDEYLGVLLRLQECGIATAGYVDKPAADLVIRLLELVEASDEELRHVREHHPLRGISDRWLFGEKNDPLLKPGERSAVFGINSKLEKDYTGGLSLCFFYLNVGTIGRPWPVRVEIPGWVADNSEKLDMLHAVLVAQCRMMGEKPYPYLLHRAHETAVVSYEEREQVEKMLILELRSKGVEIDYISYKASAKSSSGRRRY